MGEKKIKTRVQHKREYEADWSSAENFQPLDGEIIVYKADKNLDDASGKKGTHAKPRIKIGDGSTTVGDLPFIVDQEATDNRIAQIEADVLGTFKGVTVDGTKVTFSRVGANPIEINTQDTNNDVCVTNTKNATQKAYVTGTPQDADIHTGGQVFDPAVYLDTEAGTLVATKFKGTATKAVADSQGNDIYNTYATKQALQDLDSDMAASALSVVHPGEGTSSLVIGTGNAKGNRSIAGGSTDKTLVTSLLGSGLSSAFVNVSPVAAQGALSFAYGANKDVTTNTLSAASMAIGVDNVAGCLGYYMTAINFTSKKITLSTTQKYRYGGSRTKPSKLTWSVNDLVSIFYDTGHYECSKITAVDTANGEITVDSLPIDSFTLPLAADAAYPHDVSIYVPAKPQSGEVQLGFAAYARGYKNKALGVMSNAIGYDNTAVDTAAFVTGRENIGSFGSLVGGYQNKVLQETGFAVGKSNTVDANSASAMGYDNTITGTHGSALGAENVVSGEKAAAIGHRHVVSNTCSFASGYNNEATAPAAHAEGSSTKAQGETSHTEGQTTLAEGYSAHAEGNRTWAKGAGAHAEGYRTTAYGARAHSEGDSSTQYTDALIENRTEDTTVKKIIGHWNETADTNKYSIAFGTATHVEGQDSIATGDGAHAEGIRTQATGKYSHAEGSQTQATGSRSHAEGSQTQATGASSHAEGDQTIASGASGAHAEGYKAQASGAGSHAEGGSTKATGETSHAEGQSTTASGKFSHAEGSNTSASGNGSHAEGLRSIASGSYSHAEGNYYTKSKKHYLTDYGFFNDDQNAGEMGPPAYNWCPEGLADGDYVRAYYYDNTEYSFGVVRISLEYVNYDSFVNEYDPTAKPDAYRVVFPDAVGEVHPYYIRKVLPSYAVGQASHTEGTGNKTSGSNSHVEGYCNTSEHANQHVQGKWNVPGNFAHIVGGGTESKPKNIHTVDWDGNAVYTGKVTAGVAGTGDLDLTTNSRVNTIITEKKLSSIGQPTTEGGEIFNAYYSNEATGAYSHAEGEVTTAAAEAAHAEGRSSSASGIAAHAEGNNCHATANFAHAEGDATYSQAKASHTEGVQTCAYTDGSHAEGYLTQAGPTDENRDSFGWSADFDRTCAHAEGIRTCAFGAGSHAEGLRTVAISNYSHVEGQGTSTVKNKNGDNITGQHVQGKWNSLTPGTNSYAHIIGWGSDDANRKNIHTVDVNGNAEYLGDLKTNSGKRVPNVTVSEVAPRSSDRGRPGDLWIVYFQG